MLEDEEAIDYGEDELVAPDAGQDEVSLMLEEDNATPAAPAESTGQATPAQDVAGAAMPSEEADAATRAAVPKTGSRSIDLSDKTVQIHEVAKEQETTQKAAATKGASSLPGHEQKTDDTTRSIRHEQANADARSSSFAGKEDSNQKKHVDVESRSNAHDRRGRGDGDEIAPGWRTIKSRSGDGEVYYYNESTGESSWQKPTVARESRNRAPQASNSDAARTGAVRGEARGAHGAGGAGTDAGAGPSGKKKSKKSRRRAKDAAARADADADAAVATAARQQQSSQRGQGARDQGQDARKSQQLSGGRKNEPASTQSEQGFSIKGAAQRKVEPSTGGAGTASNLVDGVAPKERRDQRSDGRSNDKQDQRQRELAGKRKRGNAASENGRGRGNAESTPASNGEAKPDADAVSGESKRQRTDRDDRSKDSSAVTSRSATSWQEDAPRDRRMADTWRPGADSDRAGSRYADEARWSDRREAWLRDRERDTAPAADRRRDADIRERGKRDDRSRELGRERKQEHDRDDRSAARSDASKPTASNSDSQVRKAAGPRDAAASGRASDERRGKAHGKGNGNGNRTERGRDGRGKEETRDRQIQQQPQQRQRGSKGQPSDLSSINSTSSQNKRQWGSANQVPPA